MLQRKKKQQTENYAELTLSFPHKLFVLMSREDGNTIKWDPHGLSFRITEQDEFVHNTIPKYFKRKLFIYIK